MTLTNNWVGYLDRTYEQIKGSAITRMGNAVPEITDHTESNPYIIELGIWAGMTENIQYYVDNAAREAFLATARLYESMVKIAKFANYRIRGVKSATVDLTFTLSQTLPTNFSIPVGTTVATEDGIQFLTTVGNVIPAGQTSLVIPASQMVLVKDVQLGVSDGTSEQHFILTEDTEDKSVTVKVNGVGWTFVEDITSTGFTDTAFTTSLNADGLMEVIFGDGIFGAIPASGATISASYGVSVGDGGNLAENSINTITSTLANPSPATLSVTNLNRSGGGSNIESLEDLRKAIPKINRTNRRAVTKLDYQDIAELNAGVRAASVKFTCGKEVEVYIVPNGGGSASQLLLNSVKDDFYDETRMVTTAVKILPAGEVMLFLEWDVNVLSSFSKIETEQNVRAALLTYINDTNLELSNSTEIGNLYEVIESVKGVDYSKMIKMYVKPYAQITSGNHQLNWVRDLKEASTEVIFWDIKFTSTGEFELLRNGIYNGTIQLNQLVDLPEIAFSIGGNEYSGGDSWRFVTYPLMDSISLNEPSILVLTNENLKLNMNGGI